MTNVFSILTKSFFKYTGAADAYTAVPKGLIDRGVHNGRYQAKFGFDSKWTEMASESFPDGDHDTVKVSVLWPTVF